MENIWLPLSFITERHNLKCKNTYFDVQIKACVHMRQIKKNSNTFFLPGYVNNMRLESVCVLKTVNDSLYYDKNKYKELG